MNWLGIDENLVEKAEVEQEEYLNSIGELKSGIYKVKCKEAFIYKSSGGATGLNVDLVTEDDRHIFGTFWIKSGDNKGNKATYKGKDGKDHPLPDVLTVTHLFKVAGSDIAKPKFKDYKTKVYGVETDAILITSLVGKQFKVVVQQYEDDYNDEVTVKLGIKDFINTDGTNYKGEPAEESWNKILEKTPIKKLKSKPKAKVEDKSVDDILADF